MTWNLLDAQYPQISINDNHVAELAKWLEKIAELAPQYKGEWNVMIGDIWPNDNMSRLIGHVQMNDVAVGYDTGYRVCAYLHGGGIVGNSGNDRPLIKKWLTEAAANTQTNKTLKALASTNPFEIRVTMWGDNPISDAPKVGF